MATVQAVWKGRVLAESESTRRVEGNHYFPPDSVDRSVLVETDRTSICPWKGRARYYDVVVGGEANPGAAWYYPRPFLFARRIRGHVAFWQGVQVREVDPAERP